MIMVPSEKQIGLVKLMTVKTKRTIDRQGKSDYLVGVYNGLELALSVLEGRDGDARLIIPEQER